MTLQDFLILSYFSETVPRKFDDRCLTTEMIEAGIGINDGAKYPYYEIIHRLKNEGLLIAPKKSSAEPKGISRATSTDFLVLSNEAALLIQREQVAKKRKEYISEIEFNKLKIEHDLLYNQLTDYKRTKRQAFWALIMSVISTLAAIATLIFS